MIWSTLNKGSPHLDLEFRLHVSSHVLSDVARLSSCFISPSLEIVKDFLFHVAHVDPRSTDGDSREGNFGDWLGRVLQSCHHLIIIMIIMVIVIITIIMVITCSAS